MLEMKSARRASLQWKSPTTPPRASQEIAVLEVLHLVLSAGVALSHFPPRQCVSHVARQVSIHGTRSCKSNDTWNQNSSSTTTSRQAEITFANDLQAAPPWKERGAKEIHACRGRVMCLPMCAILCKASQAIQASLSLYLRCASSFVLMRYFLFSIKVCKKWSLLREDTVTRLRRAFPAFRSPSLPLKLT